MLIQSLSIHPRPQPCRRSWAHQEKGRQQKMRPKRQNGNPARGGAAAVPCMNRDPSDSPELGPAELQKRLLEQARRYNDLRVAYKALCRRLDKARGVGGARATKVCGGGREKAGIAKIPPRCGRESGPNLIAAGRGTPEQRNPRKLDPGSGRALELGEVVPRRFPEV